MALRTFTPPINPEHGASKKTELKLLETEFGDGYTQISPAGINHMRSTWSFSWPVLSKPQADEIEDFFRSHGGYMPFYYTVPGDSFPEKYRCKVWESEIAYTNAIGEIYYKLTAEFVQDFSLLT